MIVCAPILNYEYFFTITFHGNHFAINASWMALRLLFHEHVTTICVSFANVFMQDTILTLQILFISTKFPLHYTKILMWILLFVHIINIGDTQTCKIYFFNNGFYLCQLTEYHQLFIIN